MNDLERSKFKVTPKIRWFSNELHYLKKTETRKHESEQMNDVTKIRQYLTFNMGKSYTFVESY